MRQRLIASLIALLIVAGFFGAYWHSQSQTTLAGFEEKIALEINKALGGNITIAGVEFISLNKMLLHDVTIKDNYGDIIAKSGKVTLSFSLFSILKGEAAVSSINELALDKPEIILNRRTDGRWNVQDILDHTQKGDSLLRAKILLENATVTLKMNDNKWLIENIEGSVDLADNPQIGLKISAAYKKAPLGLSGRINQQQSSFLELKAASLPLEDFKPLLSTDSPLKTLTGKITELQTDIRFNNGNLTYDGSARLDNVGIDIKGLPIRNAKGVFCFSENSLYFFGSDLKVHDQDLRLNGKIAIDGTEPVYNLQISANNFNPETVMASSPVLGSLSFTASVAGTASDLTVYGDARLKQGKVKGYSIYDAKSSFSYSKNTLTISRFDTGAFGGRLAGNACIDTRSNSFRANISGKNVDFALLPPLGINISGKGDMSLTADGAGDLESAHVSGTVNISSGTVFGVPFATLTSGFTKNAGHISVEYITVGFHNGGMATATGAVQNDILNFKVFGHAVPLTDLTAKYKDIQLEGLADIDGSISGDTRNPYFSASFKAYNGKCYSQPFALAEGSIQLDNGRIELVSLKTTNGVTSHIVNGTIDLSASHNLDLSIVTHQARAENIAELIMPGQQITGNVDNELRITGPAANYTAEGRIKLTEGSFHGYLVASASGSYRREGGVTKLIDFTIDSLNTKVKLNGVIAADRSMNIDVVAQEIDIAALNFKYPYPVAGLVNLEGKLTGLTTKPMFKGTVVAKSLSLNHCELKDLDGTIVTNGSQIDIPVFSFSQREGKFSLFGGINTDSGAVQAEMNVDKGSMADLLTILNIPGKDIDGSLEGHISVQGTVTNPSISMTGTLANGNIKNYPLDTIEIDVGLKNNVFTINKFFAKQGNGVLAARGTAAVHGPLNLEIGGRDIDAGLITTWFDSTINTKGNLNFAAQITGTSDLPHASVSLEIKGGGVANATFDSLYGLFILDNNKISVNQLMLIKGPYKASAYGSIPLAALSQKGRNAASATEQMSLKLRLDKANLSILPMLTKEVTWAVGETTGELTIAGTLAQPLLYGGFSVNNGTVKLASLADPIQKVGVDIQFDGDKINVKSFEGIMGSGNYRLSGDLLLKGLALKDYNMLLVLDKLGINHKNFKGPISGTMMLSNKDGKPLLRGKLAIENAEINIPAFPEFTSSNNNLGLDVEILAGEKVRLYNPYLYDVWVDGRVKFAGTVNRPDVSGRFEAIRGTVSYLRTQFKVNSGSAEFTQFRSFIPVIKLKAETQLENTRVYLDIDGPPNAMQLHLTSQPAMSQQEILMLLTLRNRYFDNSTNNNSNGIGRDEVIGLLNAGMQMTFLTEAEGAFRNYLNLNEFRLVQGDPLGSIIIPAKSVDISSQQNYSLSISKYINDRLLLGYSHGVDHQGYTISFNYYVNKRFSITGMQDEKNNVRFGVETRFNF